MDDDLGELIEKLCVANIKLFKVCDMKAAMSENPGKFSKQEILDNMAADIYLCTLRASLKNKINAVLGNIVPREIKNYG